MKKHLFYAWLSIFLFTAALTVMGLAGLLQIEQRRLDMLLMIVLGQLVVVIASLLGWTVLSPKTPAAAPRKARRGRISSRATALSAPDARARTNRLQPLDIPRTAPARLSHAPEKVALTAPGFFKANSKLKARPPEWERWLESISGKQVIWHGTLIEVRRKKDGVLMSMLVSSILENFLVTADGRLAGVISSFQKGDFLKVEGIFLGVDVKPSLKAISVNRLDSF